VKEEQLIRARDALAAERRRMPWLAVEQDDEFDDGKASLLGPFDGRRQRVKARMGWETVPWYSTWSYLASTALGRHEEWEDSPHG
jgi:Bacterial protein of unknown function (DUF899)